MQDDQDSPSNDSLNEQVMESIGANEEQPEVNQEESSDKENDLPKYAKEKLGMQEKRHKKEIRKLKSQIDELASRMNFQSSPNTQQENPYMSQSDNYSANGNNQAVDPMQHAVAAAMQAIENKQKQQQDMERMQHLHKQYQDLTSDLANGSDKYDDFDEVVMDKSKAFTPAMQEAALLIPNRTDVFYKLGKNPDELQRISKLQPIEQAKEMVKLSIALIGGNGGQSASTAVKTMGNIKSNPVSNSSSQVSEKTPFSDLRRRIKAGWK